MAKTIRDELKDTFKAKGGQQGDLTNDSQTIAGMIKAINKAEAASSVLSLLTIAAAPDATDFWGTTASQIQDEIEVSGNQITGKLFEQTEGQIVNDRGPGYFIGIKLSDLDADATSVLVGMDPSQGSGLVEIIDDPDKIYLGKVTYKDSQVLKVVQSDGTVKRTQVWGLSGLTLVPADEEE